MILYFQVTKYDFLGFLFLLKFSLVLSLNFFFSSKSYFSGEGGHRVEICPQQALDLILWGGGHSTATIQHHTHTQVTVLLAEVVVDPGVQGLHQAEERTPADGEGRACLLLSKFYNQSVLFGLYDNLIWKKGQSKASK